MKRPCLDCGRLSPNSRCPIHARAYDNARYAARGTTTQRGLGWEHRKQTAEQIKAVPYCQGCGHTGSPDNPLTGEHSTPRAHGGATVNVTLCRSCNSRLGGRMRVG